MHTPWGRFALAKLGFCDDGLDSVLLCEISEHDTH